VSGIGNVNIKKVDVKYAKNVITTYNTKLRPTSISSVKKSLDNTNLYKAIDKTNRYMTSSIDNIDEKGGKSKASQLSPGKIQINLKNEKTIQISNTATKSVEINVKPLNDLINFNNKSRNVPNNLTNNRSSLFNSDKVQSQYSASYNNKNQMYSQIITKGVPAKHTKSKANSTSKSRINSSIGTKKTPSKVQLNLKSQVTSIRTSQKVIPTATEIKKQDQPLISEERETKAKSNLSVFLNKNFNLLTNTQSKGKVLNKPRQKPDFQ
jgi:hypothetical protein